MDTVCDLANGRCKPCEGGVPPLSEAEASRLMTSLNGWSRAGQTITKTYHFADYKETICFVNATAWISEKQGHHPDLAVGYDQCVVSYTTHAISGLSENDFICAAKIDALLAP